MFSDELYPICRDGDYQDNQPTPLREAVQRTHPQRAEEEGSKSMLRGAGGLACGI